MTTEQRVIALMREAIATYHSDPENAYWCRRDADRLFSARLMEWSDAFARLQQEMYAVWCAYTPQPKGQYRTRHIMVGRTPHPVSRWVDDPVQPPLPTTETLLARFDQCIAVYMKESCSDV